MTTMSNAKLNTINNENFFNSLLKSAYKKFSLQNFIKFISHKNHLGMTALLISIRSVKKDFVSQLLLYMKKIILRDIDHSHDLYDLFFNQNYITSSNKIYSLINSAIITNNDHIFSTLMEGIEEIYEIKHPLYLKFINNNLPTSPIVLTSILAQDENFRILVEKASIAYEDQPLELVNYLSQKELFKKNILEIVSVQHLILKLTNQPKNIEILNAFLHSPIDKSIIDQLDDNRAKNGAYSINIFNSLIDALLKVSNNNELIFDYFTISNSKGEIFLHLIDNNDMSDDSLLVLILNKIRTIFHTDTHKFLKIINYRDFRGFTPFLVTKSSEEKKNVCNLLTTNYNDMIDQKARPYNQLPLANEVNFFNINYIQSDSQTYSNILGIDQLKKESMFSLFSYLFQNTDAQALNACVQDIIYNKPNILQLDQEEREQIAIYQKAIDDFYNYILAHQSLLSDEKRRGYTSDSINTINSTLTELFINNSYQYVLLCKSSVDTLLIGKSTLNYYFFSHSLFSPTKNFLFTFLDNTYHISAWIKKYFFIDRSESKQEVIFHPFNFFKNSSHANLYGIDFNQNYQHYGDKLNQLNLTIIITDKMLPEQKILGLPIKFIQEFFAIDTLFINIEKFKNHQKIFLMIFLKN
ncbi:hypothetical protein [Rickettsiella massiliensis]|uniref:hypothetical protein n=1 Tax=Rickettsiella massiliensis TaxID=676517 RepID=UPI0002DB2C31|nr:hypothetical protein [Rickettsiella massiliensis]